MGRLEEAVSAVSKVTPVLGFLCVKFTHRTGLLSSVPRLGPFAKFLELGKNVRVLDVRMLLTLRCCWSSEALGSQLGNFLLVFC